MRKRERMMGKDHKVEQSLAVVDHTNPMKLKSRFVQRKYTLIVDRTTEPSTEH